jgi:hypothetical protein
VRARVAYPLPEQPLAIHGLIAHEILSWGAKRFGPLPRSASLGTVSQLPAVGSGVWVQFDDGDPSHPEWTGVQ